MGSVLNNTEQIVKFASVKGKMLLVKTAVSSNQYGPAGNP